MELQCEVIHFGSQSKGRYPFSVVPSNYWH